MHRVSLLVASVKLRVSALDSAALSTSGKPRVVDLHKCYGLITLPTPVWLGREMLVQEKNMDIERFRLELDAILGAARELALAQKHPPPVADQTQADFAKRPAQPLRALDPNSQQIARP